MRQQWEWHTRTWYGLPVRVLVTSENVHEVWVGPFPLPHLGLVNWVSRQGLPLSRRLELTARHELGHVQTAPLALGFLAWWLCRLRQRWGPVQTWPWTHVLVALAVQHLLWELMAESYVLVTSPRSPIHQRPAWSRRLYRGFWTAMVASLLGLLRWVWR